MNTLIRSAKVIDNESSFNNRVVDLRIENGIIKNIGSGLQLLANEQEISLPNLHVSPGWFDSSVNFGEPGYEERETIAHGLEVAARSGFTAIALNPANNPVTDNKGAVSFLKNKAKSHVTELYPIGSLTKAGAGKELAELFDMQQSGAVAFGDYQSAITNANLLKIALQYCQNFDGLVLSYPQENSLAATGMVNEHHTSTYLGLKGIPALAEELQVLRDIQILEYTGGKLHIPTISTARAVDHIREAKENGLDITCSVSVHHLFFTDEALHDFNTDAKVRPPLRTKSDTKALINALKDGTIDMVTSDHSPIDVEHKKVEFENASYGTIGLETALGALLQLVSPKIAIKALTAGKSRFGIFDVVIEEGATADLSFFDPEIVYNFDAHMIHSSSKNSLFTGRELKGRVLGVFSKGKYFPSTN